MVRLNGFDPEKLEQARKMILDVCDESENTIDGFFDLLESDYVKYGIIAIASAHNIPYSEEANQAFMACVALGAYLEKHQL